MDFQKRTKSGMRDIRDYFIKKKTTEVTNEARDCVRDFQKRTKSGMKDIRDYFIKKQQTEVATEEATEEEIVQ